MEEKNKIVKNNICKLYYEICINIIIWYHSIININSFVIDRFMLGKGNSQRCVSNFNNLRVI